MTESAQNAETPEMGAQIRLVIFGRQGSGKGTQCAQLVESFGCVHISTGDMLRAAVDAETDLGLAAKQIMDDGGLVSDEIMIGIVADRLAESDAVNNGFLLDGFPRTPAQAEALHDILVGLNQSLTASVNLDVPEDEVTERMLARGRKDDTPEAIANRLGLYEAQTAPLFAWFQEQGLLEVVDGLGSEEEVAQRLAAVMRSRLDQGSAGE